MKGEPRHESCIELRQEVSSYRNKKKEEDRNKIEERRTNKDERRNKIEERRNKIE